MVLFSRKIGEGVIIVQDDEPDQKTIGTFWAEKDQNPLPLEVANGTEFTPIGLRIGSTVLRLDHAIVALG